MSRVVAGSLVCLLLGSAPAWASTAEAWQAHDAMVRAACLKASGLRQVRAVGQVLPFDDEVGYSALLLQGRYPQPHMQGRQGREPVSVPARHRQGQRQRGRRPAQALSSGSSLSGSSRSPGSLPSSEWCSITAFNSAPNSTTAADR